MKPESANSTARKKQMKIESRTTSWGQNGNPSTLRNFFFARAACSSFWTSSMYSLTSESFCGGFPVSLAMLMGLRDPLDPDDEDVQTDHRVRDDRQDEHMQDVHPRN